jgi:hypothetical protein
MALSARGIFADLQSNELDGEGLKISSQNFVGPIVRGTCPCRPDSSPSSMAGGGPGFKLCRDLCRNPAIPDPVGCVYAVSLGSNLQTADNRPTRMNRVHSYRSISLLVVPFLFG